MNETLETITMYLQEIKEIQNKMDEGELAQMNELKESLVWANTDKNGRMTETGLMNVITSYLQFLKIYKGKGR